MLQVFRRISGVLLGLIVLLQVYGLPQAEAAIISTKEEISIGKNVAKELEKKYGLVEDQELQNRVDRIGQSLAAVSERRDLQYSFKVLNSKEVNALAAPGGFIYVFKGLVDHMPSDEELAGVLSHEVGHVVKRHTVRQIEKSLLAQVLFGVLFGDRGVMLQNLAFNAIMSGYSRDDEREADQVGFNQALQAGYNPYSMAMTLSKLDDLDRKGNAGLFSTHPEPDARAKRVMGYIESIGVKPSIVIDEKSAQVVDGTWQLPAYAADAEGYKPKYRAYFAAGALYQAAKQPNFRCDNFIVLSDEGKATIYYDDLKITVLTQQDAALSNTTLAELTDQYILKLREWAAPKDQNKTI